jgi:hypothetical protein
MKPPHYVVTRSMPYVAGSSTCTQRKSSYTRLMKMLGYSIVLSEDVLDTSSMYSFKDTVRSSMLSLLSIEKTVACRNIRRQIPYSLPPALSATAT